MLLFDLSRSRPRNSTAFARCPAVFGATVRIPGCRAALTMASTSAASLGGKTIHWIIFCSASLWRLTMGAHTAVRSAEPRARAPPSPGLDSLTPAGLERHQRSRLRRHEGQELSARQLLAELGLPRHRRAVKLENTLSQIPPRSSYPSSRRPLRPRGVQHHDPGALRCRQVRAETIPSGWLYNQQLPQFTLGSFALQAIWDWNKNEPQLFNKKPCYLRRCDS